MPLVLLKCTCCKKDFFRASGHANETKKLGRKPYCSIKCVAAIKTIHNVRVRCESPGCRKEFDRTPAQVSPHNYCSHSCAAKVINARREKKIKTCPECSKKFTGHNKYCSLECIPRRESQYDKQTILNAIQEFTHEQDRIPTKKELNKIYRVARQLFGTWNNAIKAAGFDPNPVMFAKKYIANDGDKCDSLAEKIIDDWLYARGIDHKRSTRYPGSLGFTADFLVRDTWIEFFGLHGQHKRYDELRRDKLKLTKKYGLKLVELYPGHLFPKNQLDNLLVGLVK